MIPMRLPRLARPFLLATIGLLLLAGPVAAGDFRGDDSVTITEGETVDDDLYAAGGTITIAGTVNGDATVAGGTVTVTGSVGGSLNVGGGTVDVLGDVEGAVRVTGGTVRIAGSVGRDVVILGGNVTLDPDADIAGDVAGGTGDLTVSGHIAGDLYVGAGTVRLTPTAVIDGMIEATVDQLVIDSGATVAGDVIYTSSREASVASGARIAGSVERREPPASPATEAFPDNPILSYIGLLLGMLLFGWSLLAVRPRLVLGSSEALRTAPLPALGLGCVAWITQFVLIVLLVVLGAVLGAIAGAIGGAFIVAAIVVLLLLVILLFLSSVPVAMAIGRLVMRGDTSAYLVYLAGAAILAAVIVLAGLVPALGAIVGLVVWILGLGAFTLYAWRTRRMPYSVEPPAPAQPVSEPPWPAPAAPG
jgi:cytoskeletal protein CcmA (bactofilin family)